MKLKYIWGGIALILALGSAALTTSHQPSSAAESDETRIAIVTARLLQNSAYSGHQESQAVSERFLDRYLESLDGNHLYLLQSDVDEFAPCRKDLELQILKSGDTHPGHRIFARFLERVEQRVAYAQELLKQEAFDFTGRETYQWDRHEAPRPRNVAEAKHVWRQHLRYEYLQEKLNDRKPEEIVNTLSRRYERTLKAMKHWSDDQVLEVYLTALAHAYDPHSDYMGRQQSEDFGIAMKLSLVGIGATLQAEDGYCKIRELVPGGPAARSQLLKAGDRIVAVAQGDKELVDVIDMPLPEAVGLIRGPKGTVVKLAIIPGDSGDSSQRKVISLVRDEIRLEGQEAKARLVELRDNTNSVSRLGVIDLPSFYSGAGQGESSSPKSASADVAKLIQKLKEEKVQGLILDLRRNGGGSLEEAIALTGLFIKRGPVVQTKAPTGDVRVEYDPDPTALYDGPLVVLTSRFSASASEILAGALQDYGRAVIVGDTSTFGKGTVQSMMPLADVMRRAGLSTATDPGALKLTIRKFYRPGGASTQLKGVASDIVVPSPTAELKVSEAEMPDPLPWDSVRPAQHADLDAVAAWLPGLREASAKRIAEDPDFTCLRKENQRIHDRLNRPVVSLNEKQRREEKAELDAQVEARKKELSTRSVPPETAYEITLKNAEKPGLPNPLSDNNVASHRDADNEGADPADQSSGDQKDAPDLTLREARNILRDYIDLRTRGPGNTVAQHSAGDAN